MRLRTAFISDVHANLEALGAALGDIQRRGVDRIYCLGDTVNYGAEPNDCLKRVREAVVRSIQGNHEAALVSDRVAETFNPYAQAAIHWTRKQLSEEDRYALSHLAYTHVEENWTMVHATLEAPHEFSYLYDPADALRNFPLMKSPVCFYGHTHVPLIFSERACRSERLGAGKRLLSREDRYIINVGSIGQPRDRDPRLGYLIFDEDAYEIEMVRMPYDVHTTQKKIRAAGLPEILAARLEVGT